MWYIFAYCKNFNKLAMIICCVIGKNWKVLVSKVKGQGHQQFVFQNIVNVIYS